VKVFAMSAVIGVMKNQFAIISATFMAISCSKAVPPIIEDRVAAARVKSGVAVATAFKKAGIAYPPERVHLRGFKREGELELWAAGKSGRFGKVAVYSVLGRSGVPGPKRKEGDLQVPEGFYEIDRYNPKSLFHLSLGLNYPNAADRILSDPKSPGTDIFIHGDVVTIGCLPMGDEMVEQLFLAAIDAKEKPVSVHLFPARMSGNSWKEWRDAEIAKNPALKPFWEQLQPGYDYFEKRKRVPEITVRPDGSYRVNSR
jgi:murein L,D-transpeptidase YafK